MRLQVASSTSSFAHYLLEGFYSFMKSLDAHILVDYIMVPICTHKIIPLNMPTDPNICLPKCPTDTNTCVLLAKFGRTNLHSRGRRPPGGDSELDEHTKVGASRSTQRRRRRKSYPTILWGYQKYYLYKPWTPELLRWILSINASIAFEANEGSGKRCFTTVD